MHTRMHVHIQHIHTPHIHTTSIKCNATTAQMGNVCCDEMAVLHSVRSLLLWPEELEVMPTTLS